MKRGLSPRVLLMIIASMFLLPLVLAWFMHSGVIDYTPGHTRNHGVLVQPPVPVSWKDVFSVPELSPLTESNPFEDHWTMLKVVPVSCPAKCLEQLTELRQVHRASGRHQSRILIALLLRNPDLQKNLARQLLDIYDRYELLADSSGFLQKSLKKAAPGMDGVYLIDPLGNIMMTYEDGTDPNHLKQDLTRLLTWSKLDE